MSQPFIVRPRSAGATEGVRAPHPSWGPLAGTTVSVRIPRTADVDLDGLQGRGMFGPDVRDRLEALVAERANVLLSGAGGTGNTTWNL